MDSETELIATRVVDKRLQELRAELFSSYGTALQRHEELLNGNAKTGDKGIVAKMQDAAVFNRTIVTILVIILFFVVLILAGMVFLLFQVSFLSAKII